MVVGLEQGRIKTLGFRIDNMLVSPKQTHVFPPGYGNFVVLLVCDKFDRHVGTMVLPVCTVPWCASGAPEQGGSEQVRALLAGQVPLDTRSVLTGLRSAVAIALGVLFVLAI